MMPHHPHIAAFLKRILPDVPCSPSSSLAVQVPNFRGFFSLTNLDMSYNQFVSLEALSSLPGPRLTHLYCAANKIASMEGIAHLESGCMAQGVAVLILPRKGPCEACTPPRCMPRSFTSDITGSACQDPPTCDRSESPGPWEQPLALH